MIKFLLFIFPLVVCNGEDYGPYNKQLNDLLKNIENLVHFYKREYRNMNIDGIYGLRVLQGELLYLSGGGDTYVGGGDSGRIPYDIQMKLTQLQSSANTVGSMALEALNVSDPGYYSIMGFLIKSPWQPTVFFRQTQSYRKWDQKIMTSRDVLTEKESDKCFHNLKEVSRMFEDEKGKCSPTPECIQLMLMTKGLSEYQITHQVLYTTLAQKVGCFSILNQLLSHNGTSMYDIQMELCTNVHHQMMGLITVDPSTKDASIERGYEDLVMEQIFVCGSIGFMELAHLPLLPLIMSWQQTSGCYGDALGKTDRTANRRLLEERTLAGSCLSHKTSVAAAALSQFLRIFLDSRLHLYFPHLPNYLDKMLRERTQFQRRRLPPVQQDAAHPDLRQEGSEIYQDVWLPYVVVVRDRDLQQQEKEEEEGAQFYQLRSPGVEERALLLQARSVGQWEVTLPVLSMTAAFCLLLCLLMLMWRRGVICRSLLRVRGIC